MSVRVVVSIIKKNMARELKRKSPFFQKAYWGTDAAWSAGYFASTVRADDAVIEAYIEVQGKQDAGQKQFEAS